MKEKNNYNYNIRNIAKVNNRIDVLFKDYSKLSVIRIDFSILKEHGDVISHENMTEYISNLRNNMRKNSIFKHYITYISKLEYGQEKSWHYHMIFFFDGSYVNHDINKADQIGEYWVNTITKNMGCYYNANKHKQEYYPCGIGNIQYHETKKINYLKKAASYLTKEDKNIILNKWKDKSGKTIRTFNMGRYKQKNSNRGRPRIYDCNHFSTI